MNIAIVEDNFIEVYRELGKEWNRFLEKSPCKSCDLNKTCFTCLARRHLEGDMLGCSDYLRSYAEECEK